jgi:hypothetical protein
MSATVLYMSISLDGFIAGPNETAKCLRPASPHPFDGRRAMQNLFVYAHLGALDLGDRLRRRLGSERAQGTVEYVGLFLLVFLLMVGMVAAMKGFNNKWPLVGLPARA